jgi:siroheme synthase (precorrin-2 oxidase/ferrochelatase)
MTQIIIHTDENGNVNVTIPTGEISIEEVLAKDCPAHAVIVNSADLPNEHNDFFNAWELADGQVTVNIDKATDITKNRLRAERTPLLTALDVQYQRALESGADTKAIVAEKQRLRDITKISVTTLDELKGLSA